MKTLLTVLGIALAVGLLAYGWQRQDTLKIAQEEFHLTKILGEQSGYILTPPEFVAQPFIRRIEWSPDGRYAVLFQTVVRLEGTVTEPTAVTRQRILMWNRETRRVNVLWESPITTQDIALEFFQEVAFFSNTRACVFTVIEEVDTDSLSYGVYYAPLGGRAIRLGAFEGRNLLAPPTDDAVYLFWFRLNQEARRIEYAYAPISPSGRLGEPRPLPEVLWGSAHQLMKEIKWHADGKWAIVEVVSVTPTSQDGTDVEVQHRYFAWNPRTNEVRELAPSELRYYEPKQAQRPAVEQALKRLQHKTAQGSTPTTWLLEGDQAALIAADSTLAQVSPQGDAILYVAHGAAFYRSLIALNANEARALLEQEKIDRYTAQGKQVALALLQYALDYDELFPPNYGDEAVAEIISLYLRDKQVLSIDGVFAFRYLLDGVHLADIESPVDTLMGYLETPDGRVEIFVDGHVKFKRKR